MHKQGLTKKWPSHYDLGKLTSGTSSDLGVNAQSIQVVCEQFAKSRNQHKKCPKFRASGGPKRALGWIPFQQQSRQIKDNGITYLGKTYRFFGTDKRPLPTVTKGGAFVEDACGKWWVCFHVEVDALPIGDGEVGIDLGLKTLATCSDGEKIQNPTSYRQLEAKLATAQRAGNHKRAKTIHCKITNIRKDHQHKASAKLADANRLIVVGNVNATGLAKTRMAKSVFDAGWSMFRNMLRYKASRHEATFLEVNESFTTQTCSTCGSLPESRPRGITGLGIREWVCSDCGASHDRDVNAARNILTLGRSTAPRVDESRAA
jgi:IS605 OrfB family transposase